MIYTNEENMSLKKVWKNKFIRKVSIVIRRNIILIATMSAFLLLSIVNAMMICTFFEILQRG